MHIYDAFIKKYDIDMSIFEKPSYTQYDVSKQSVLFSCTMIVWIISGSGATFWHASEDRFCLSLKIVGKILKGISLIR